MVLRFLFLTSESRGIEDYMAKRAEYDSQLALKLSLTSKLKMFDYFQPLLAIIARRSLLQTWSVTIADVGFTMATFISRVSLIGGIDATGRALSTQQQCMARHYIARAVIIGSM